MKVRETLLRAIKTAGVSRYKISQDTGIEESSLSRFMQGQSDPKLSTVDTLAVYFNLELRPAGTGKARRKGR